MVASAAVALALLSVSPYAFAEPAHSTTTPFDRDFWLALKASSFAVPAGHTADAILLEAEPLVASPDPVLRDDVAYGLAVAWIYRERKVDTATVRTFADRLERRMRDDVGGPPSDATLSRSFAALLLSIVAAADLNAPAFDDAQFARVLDVALSNLGHERDVRGYEPRVGWIHATAHTADLVKFLARSPRVTRAHHRRIVEALVGRVESMPQTFAWGEDERLAAALRSVVVRDDADLTAFDAWLARLPEQHAALWASTPLDVTDYVRLQNAKLVLRALYVSLSAGDAPTLPPLRDKVLRCLSQLL